MQHVRLDLAGRADARSALDDHPGWITVSGPIVDVRVDVGGRRVHERDPGRHQLFVLLLSHEPAHLRELRPAVDAADFVGGLRRRAFRPASFRRR